jgi:hypothetical protein
MNDQPPLPTLAGAQHGRVRPVRQVPGGVWFAREDGDLECLPAALRIVPQKKLVRCEDLARQFLKSRGDREVAPLAYASTATLFWMHEALIAPPATPTAPLVSLCPLPPGIADQEGRLVLKMAGELPLWELADGQLQHLRDQYELLLATETPPSITHEQWEAIVREAGKSSLRTLALQHGPSALIQVLHGTPAAAWRT